MGRKIRRYCSPQIAELRAQLFFGPEEVRLRHARRLERLLPELMTGRSYPYEYIFFRITGFPSFAVETTATEDKPASQANDGVIPGRVLCPDLARLLDELTRGLIESVGQDDDPVLCLAEAAERCSVCERTLRRWRREGLPLRWFVYPDGSPGRGIRMSLLGRFVRSHRQLVSRARRFSRLTEEERQRVIELAGRMRQENELGIAAVATRVADELGRTPETVRHVIRAHDAAKPSESLFPPRQPRLTGEDRAQIVALHSDGLSVGQMCARYGRSRSVIYGAIRACRVAQILNRRIRSIHHPDFDKADSWLARWDLTLPPIPPTPEVDSDADAFVAAVSHMPVLSPEQEKELFLKYNYLKHRMLQVRDELRMKGYRVALVEAFDRFDGVAGELRNHLINCNQRLVASIARRHAGPLVAFSDLMSVGTLVLMRAVESFDCARGNKFSTYLTWAVTREFARTVPEENYRLVRQMADGDRMLEMTADSNVDDGLRGEALAHLRYLVEKAFGALSAIEREVIAGRFGLGGVAPMTLDEIGDAHGLSGERVRQIQNSTIEKLRHLLGPEAAEPLPE